MQNWWLLFQFIIKCLLNEVEDFSKVGELAVTLSSSDVLDKENDVWTQIVGLRRQMEKLVTQLGSRGLVVQELKCHVRGFLLKAYKATTQFNNFSITTVHDVGDLAKGDFSWCSDCTRQLYG